MDSFTGYNYNKVPNQPGEYYQMGNPTPVIEMEWDEEEYWNKWVPTKSTEQVNAELSQPMEALTEKVQHFQNEGEGFTWTPALQMMTSKTPPARPLYFK